MDTPRHELGVSEIGRGNIWGFDWSTEVIINGGVWSEVAASVTSTDGLGLQYQDL